jgi:hypothetical protein
MFPFLSELLIHKNMATRKLQFQLILMNPLYCPKLEKEYKFEHFFYTQSKSGLKL